MVIGLQHLILKENKYNQLNLELSVGNHYISLSAKDNNSDEIVIHKRKSFSKKIDTNSLNTILRNFLDENSIDFKIVDNVNLYQENDLYTLVPKELYDKDEKKTYLKYNTKVNDSDYISADEINELNIKNVYIPYVNVNNLLVDKFRNINYFHFNSALLKKIFHAKGTKTFFAHVSTNKLTLIIFKNKELNFFNSFEIESSLDIIYYILLIFKEKNLNSTDTKINFIIDKSFDNLLEICGKFFQNFEVIHNDDVDFLHKK